jgi:hypothetical protein
MKYGASLCAKNVCTAGANGRLSLNTTVYASGVSTRAITSHPCRVVTLVFGFMIARYVNCTSPLVNGAPSCQRTPCRR